MIEQTILDVIASAIGGDAASAKSAAQGYYNYALETVSQADGVTFNTTQNEFALVVGQRRYVIGKDILSKIQKMVGLQNSWFTDVQSTPLSIVGKAEFDAIASGGLTSARPICATLYRNATGELTLEVYPIPDSAYPVKADCKVGIRLEDIPSQYHPAILAKALEAVAASKSPRLASKLADQQTSKLRGDQITGWTGTQIRVERGLNDLNASAGRVDSGNLRP